MMMIVICLASGLPMHVLSELVNLKDFYVKSSSQVAPLYTALGMFTNIAIADGFGKPYTAARISVGGFFGTWVMALSHPALLDFGDQVVMSLISIAMGLQYAWIRLVRKRRLYV